MHTEDAGVDFIVSQFAESDGSELLDSEFGRLIRAIHDLPAPSPDLMTGEPPADTDEILMERIDRRLKKLATIASLNISAPDIGPALSAWPADDAPGCLLHMDLRPENILVRRGHPVALLDWSNALVGEPALDLSRAAEYGSLTPAALTTYGNSEAFSMTPRTPGKSSTGSTPPSCSPTSSSTALPTRSGHSITFSARQASARLSRQQAGRHAEAPSPRLDRLARRLVRPEPHGGTPCNAIHRPGPPAAVGGVARRARNYHRLMVQMIDLIPEWSGRQWLSGRRSCI
jgi:Phosphotransferase enzyme family